MRPALTGGAFFCACDRAMIGTMKGSYSLGARSAADQGAIAAAASWSGLDRDIALPDLLGELVECDRRVGLTRNCGARYADLMQGSPRSRHLQANMEPPIVDTFELLKTIGSFVGLLTGAFTLYDRTARGRPIATITYTKVGDGITPSVQITNVSDTTIVVLESSIRPDVYFLATDKNLRLLIDDQLKTLEIFSINSKQSVELTFIPRYKGDVSMDANDQPVLFSFKWRRVNATWLPQFPVTIRTRTGLIRKLYGAP
jgi:hypothetical protein